MSEIEQVESQPRWNLGLSQFALSLNLALSACMLWIAEHTLSSQTALFNQDAFYRTFAQWVMPAPLLFIIALGILISSGEKRGKINRAFAGRILIILSSIALLSYMTIMWLSKSR